MRRTIRSMNKLMKKCVPSGTVKYGKRMADILRTIAENYEDGFELPTVTAQDDGKVLKVSSGKWNTGNGDIIKINIEASQVISQSPLEIQLTDNQYSNVENAEIVKLYGAASGLFTSTASRNEGEITFSRMLYSHQSEGTISGIGIELFVITEADKKAKFEEAYVDVE